MKRRSRLIVTPSDAIALAKRLGAREPEPGDIRAMDDLPEVAHVFHWAVAAELLTARATRIVPGPYCGDLERDPVQGIIAQLADLGAAARHDQDLRLTELGGALATAAIAIAGGDEFP